MENFVYLLKEKEEIQSRLSSMFYGSVEIRDVNGKNIIYVHRRENGLQITKYVGHYSDALIQTIARNNGLAKELKKRLKDIIKQLGTLNYSQNELSDEVKLNIDIARRNLVDSIYKQSKLEGLSTTYPDTETIVNGGKVKNISASDVGKVINLKHAWEFILNENVISYPTNYIVLSQINEIVEKGFSYSAGKIRSTLVTIGGSSYIPPIPFESDIKEKIKAIIGSGKPAIDIAIDLTLFVMKSQVYLDGNKRTAIIFANHYLIAHGGGLIVIPAQLVNEYKKHLVNYYEDKDIQSIKSFLKEKCWVKLH